MSNSPFVYFGTPKISADLLSILEKNGFTPDLVVTSPDRPRGRGHKIKESAVSEWASRHNIPTLKPEKIDQDFMKTLKQKAPENGWKFFLVFAYGHILPNELIYLPKANTLNLHPSLLPKLRGPAPIRSAILEADKTGVSVIELDERMDHGPIVAQREVPIEDWPPTYPMLEEALITAGGNLLVDIIPKWLSGKITTTPQKDEAATYSRKFSATDGEIDFLDNPEYNLRKIRAFTDWPKAHFFTQGKRVLIKEAHIEAGKLIIDTIKPAGEEEISYQKFKERL